MGSDELAANIFRASQTKQKLEREQIRGKDKANQTHHDVGREVRNTIERLGGTMPEDLPTPEKSIQQLQREEQKQLKQGPVLATSLIRSLKGTDERGSQDNALGIVVYEWLCGDRPFSGTLTEVAVKHALVPPPSLHEKVPGIPASVEQVVFKTLAKDPQHLCWLL